MTLAEIAKALNCDLEGDGDLPISGVAPIDEAQPGELTFLANRKYQKSLRSTRASAVIVSREFPPLTISTLRSGNPYLSFAQSIDLFYKAPLPPPGIHATAVIADTAVIGSNPSVGPFVIVDREVVIGDNAVLHPHVVIYSGVTIGHDFTAHSHACVRENCSIGNGVTLQNGVVIGADGYGFAKREDGSYAKITQSGPVVLEDEVEVQANATVDRAAVGETRIRKGAKVDNLVQVGHGSKVGRNTLLCAQVGLAGSTDVGDDVDPDRSGRRGRPLSNRRRRHRNRADGNPLRRRTGKIGLRLSRHRQPTLVEVFGDLHQAAGNEQVSQTTSTKS